MPSCNLMQCEDAAQDARGGKCLAINKDHWRRVFWENLELALLTMPGRIVEFGRRYLKIAEPKWSNDAHSHEAWDPDWIEEWFTCLLNAPIVNAVRLWRLAAGRTTREIMTGNSKRCTGAEHSAPRTIPNGGCSSGIAALHHAGPPGTVGGIALAEADMLDMNEPTHSRLSALCSD